MRLHFAQIQVCECEFKSTHASDLVLPLASNQFAGFQPVLYARARSKPVPTPLDETGGLYLTDDVTCPLVERPLLGGPQCRAARLLAPARGLVPCLLREFSLSERHTLRGSSRPCRAPGRPNPCTDCPSGPCCLTTLPCRHVPTSPRLRGAAPRHCGPTESESARVAAGRARRSGLPVRHAPVRRGLVRHAPVRRGRPAWRCYCRARSTFEPGSRVAASLRARETNF